jgi:hypothetical protein
MVGDFKLDMGLIHENCEVYNKNWMEGVMKAQEFKKQFG